MWKPPYDEDGESTWFGSFAVELDDDEFKLLIEKYVWWKENEAKDFFRKNVDGDHEYFLATYVPQVHAKVRKTLEEKAIRFWGPEVKEDLDNFDIYVAFGDWELDMILQGQEIIEDEDEEDKSLFPLG